MSLQKKILGNGMAVAFQKVIRVLEQLVLVPFFIKAWGADYYGEWLTLTIVPNIFILSDLGFGTAAANYFVLKYAGGEKQEAANIAKSGLRIITVVVICGVCISSLLLFILDRFGVFDKSLINAHDAIIAVSILIFARLIIFYGQLFDAYYRAARRAALGINVVGFYYLFCILSGFIVLQSGGDIIMYATSQLIVAIIFLLAHGFYSTQILINFSKEGIKGCVKKDDIKAITSKGIGYLMAPIWQAIFFQGTTFVVRIVLGPAAVTVFNTIRTLTRSVNQVINMLDAVIFPEMQYEIGLKNIDKAAKIYRISVWIASAVALIGVIFLILFGRWFYGIWTNNELHVDPLVWNLLVVGILFNGLWWIGGVVFRAFNQPYKYTFAGAIFAIISVATSYVLSNFYGLAGVAVGCLVLEIGLAAYVLPLSVKFLNSSLKDFFTQGKSDVKELLLLANNKLKRK